MNHLYASPFRVYLSLVVLALAGIYAGLNLPVSLFPNSSRPNVGIQMPYGSYTTQEFIQQHGNRIESQLQPISTESVEVDQVKAFYDQDGVTYEVRFKWGSSLKSALKEVETVIHSYTSQMPEEIRNQTWVYPMGSNSGFFSASFYSPVRSLDELYKVLEPALVPKITKLKEAATPELFNPSAKEIRIELNRDRMASLQLLPRDIDEVIKASLSAQNAGSVTVGVQPLSIQVPRLFNNLEDLYQILVPTPAGKLIHITDIAHVDYDLKTTQNMSFKTSGTPSIILFVRPKPGGNVKKMSEDVLSIIHETLRHLPKDIEHKVLVDPSEFIRAAVSNVFHEVIIGALLAVAVLFLFIGSFKNTVTAAIEIPLSMILAFIPMKLSGMSLNLISLGGLALSAGMNVDASVVVMENIFRHFEKVKTPLDFSSKLNLVIQAVNEVKFSVIASTIASLVVFIPLAFTSDLTYAVLGDLAKAVVFSHGFSAFVALILVPTVRLQFMGKKKKNEPPHKSPLEKQISRLEDFYVTNLGRFIQSRKVQNITYLGSILILFGLAFMVLPRLPKEVIGKPDTDWIEMSINTQGNTLIKQMEDSTTEIESRLLKKWESKIQYTFTQVVQPNAAWIMARLKNKSDMNLVWKGLEEQFTNTPFLTFQVYPWNPAELPIPDPPHMKLTLRGGEVLERSQAARDLYQLFESKQIFPRIWANPDTQRSENIVLHPYLNLWSNLKNRGYTISPADIADYVRVMTTGRKVGELMIDGVNRDVFLRYASDTELDAEEIAGLPLNIGGKMIPLKALTRVSLEEATPSVYQEDQREVTVISGKQNEGEPSYLIPERLKQAQNLLNQWKEKQPKNDNSNLTIQFEDARKELTEALQQLLNAFLLSVALIFLILMIQFGDLINALLVMVAVPLGLIGVLVSLFVFGSTLSLNSVLGVILLNGIAVANSIILVDFLKQRVSQGLSPFDAALDSAKKRLRPILITSLTTILGMLPVALGMGEGGRILQPLGIAVSGGLWVSMGLTLFIVPALQVKYLNFKKSAQSLLLIIFTVSLAFSKNTLAAEEQNFTSSLNTILTRSTGISIQESTYEATRARNLPARFAFFPSLSMNAREPLTGTGNFISPPRQIEVQGQWNLFRWGADVAALKAANAEQRAEKTQVQATWLQVEQTGVEALVSEIQRKQEIQINLEIVKTRTELLSIAEQRYKRGYLPIQEVEKIKVDLENSKASLVNAEINEAEARTRLENLLGHSQIRIEWPWIESFRKTQGKEILEKQLEFKAIPQWQTANAQFESNMEKTSQNWRLLLPTIDLQAQYGTYVSYFGTVTAWTGYIGINVPLFDQLSLYSRAREQSFNRAASEQRLEQTQRDTQMEWNVSRQSFSKALISALQRDQTLILSRKLYQDNLQRFHAGRITANDLAVDQNRMFEAALLAIQGWSSAHIAYSRLCHSLGTTIQKCTSNL